MIIGILEVDFPNGALHTHRDSYMLEELTTVSVRKPFLPAAILFGGGVSAMSLSFGDILYVHEIGLMTAFAVASAIGGWVIGRLKLRSRELRSGDELSDTVWGSFSELNKKRREIVHAVASVRGGQS